SRPKRADRRSAFARQLNPEQKCPAWAGPAAPKHDVAPSAAVARAAQVDDREQDQRAERRHHEAPGREAVVDGTGAQQRTDQPSTDKRTHDADDDVEQDALLSVALHDDACQPADDAADDQPDDDSHACLPVICGTPVRSASHAGSGIVMAMSVDARRASGDISRMPPHLSGMTPASSGG